jgi:solute carrier family 25 carnitine/acylcarnitine transporter 20/29
VARGVFAGVVYTVTSHPFDTIKVAMQSAPPGTQRRGALAVACSIVARPTGVAGLFRGLSAPLAGTFRLRVPGVRFKGWRFRVINHKP